ncbi:MAG TPA: acetate kinase, partial [Coriobacteriia bacterium]|nr:acetate kinase [Coriobacteriia bacterium]
MSASEVHRALTRESGLLGMCGTQDMREVHALVEAGDADAALALEVFCYRARKYIGAYCAALGRVDAIVFTAGIGENDPVVRARICEGLGFFGVTLDPGRNAAPAAGERVVSTPDSRVSVLVIPTDEEAEIARLAYALVREAHGQKE